MFLHFLNCFLGFSFRGAAFFFADLLVFDTCVF
jgi:hypothetical protein